MPCYSLKCDRGPSTALEKRCHGPSSALAAELARFSSTSPPRPQQKKTQRPVLTALFDCLRRAHASPAALAIVVTGSGSKAFSAGFDINQFAKSGGGGGIDNRINDAFCELLESGAKPTVAAVRGLALGGGLEVALACNARVATKGTKLGLPELQLGILPGFGGTQRLPRLVGLQLACQMMLTSGPVDDRKALAAGLLDAVVEDASLLLPAAKALAIAIANGEKPRLETLYRTDRLEPLGVALPLLDFASAEAAKRAPHLRHPQLTLGAIREGVEKGGRAGLLAESRAFAEAASLDAHKALVHFFFAQRATKKVRGVTDVPGVSPRPMKVVAVLGGGLMGSGICTACLLNGIDVVLKEVNQQALDAGVGRVRANLASRVKKRKMTQEKADALMARLKPTLDYADFSTADMVIEAAVENVAIKQAIFADLAKACKPDAVLSTNTSTIDIDVVGAKLDPQAASRVVGNHFFSPAHIMPLLEVVRGPRSSPQAVLDTLHFGLAIKKTPVVVRSCTGFAVNRVFFPYTQAAMLAVDCGADPWMIDAAAGPGPGFGMPMGPFRLSDLVGADIGLHVGKNVVESFGERSYPAALVAAMVEAGKLGEKSGSGFYAHGGGRGSRAKPDREGMAPLIKASREGAARQYNNALPQFGPKLGINTAEDIAAFIFYPVVNEACRVVAERVVDKPSDLDVAAVMAMGFPPWRGGLIKWGDLVGPKRIVARLDAWAEAFRPAGLAGFFEPCGYLRQAAERGTALGAGVAAEARM